MAIITSGPTASLPNILAFDFHPLRGPALNTNRWIIKPFRDWGFEEESVKIVAKNTAIGAVVGAGTAGSIALIDQFTDQFQPTKKIKEYVMAGLGIGMVAGFIRGIFLVRRFELNNPRIISKSFVASIKANQIIDAFVSTHLGSLTNINEIMCPLSQQVMAYPVKICEDSHTFEYFSIIEALGKQVEKKCPLCNRVVQINDFKFNHERELVIQRSVAEIFQKMEAILDLLPKRFLGFDILPKFVSAQDVEVLTEKIKQGMEVFLEGNTEDLTEKVKHPERLSLEETLALGNFLVHQFKPLKYKIDEIYNTTGSHLRKLYTDMYIDKETHKAQSDQLDAWYTDFDIIPQECKIIRVIYKL